MLISARSRLRSASTVAVLALTAAFVAACASPQPKAMVNTKKRSKEYFAESEYGVKASPRVAFGSSNLKRGGGRDQIGKPYQVRGKMYYPKEEKGYKKVGRASWYGDAFHGRLTANGEVYDMTHLTAAHPTMPLPSYARVTNVETGSTVIVRVNDRGPYAHDRVIDLSSKAADLLDYKRHGTATVKVEYVGRAPLHGEDEQYLMASYRPGNRAPDPSDGLPTGVMIAMNGPTPSAAVGLVPPPFPVAVADSRSVAVAQAPIAGAESFDTLSLPAFGPIAPERPDIGLPANSPFAMASLSYAPAPSKGNAGAFAALEGHGLTAGAIVDSWQRMKQAAQEPAVFDPYVAAGSFATSDEAERLAKKLSSFGRIEIEKSDVDGTAWFSVTLHTDGRGSVDDMLAAAWANGAADAMTVRD
jgi:rare lipoprotein A